MANSKQQERELSFSYREALRSARESRGYTREQIAARADITERYLAALEVEQRKPGFNVLTKIIHAIGCSADELFYPNRPKGIDTGDHVRRLFIDCSERDQQLILNMIDNMLDIKETGK